MSVLNNEITTPRQAKNGTRMFLCERTGARYGSYASGYVRREIDVTFPIFHPVKGFIDRTISKQYQINPRPFVTTKDNAGNEVRTRCIELYGYESERLERIEKLAANYKLNG